MSETLADLCAAVEAFASRFDARLLAEADAARVLTAATSLKNIAATIEALASARVTECGAWKRAGVRSPAEYVAKQTGVSVGAAVDALRVAEQLEALPA